MKYRCLFLLIFGFSIFAIIQGCSVLTGSNRDLSSTLCWNPTLWSLDNAFQANDGADRSTNGLKIFSDSKGNIFLSGTYTNSNNKVVAFLRKRSITTEEWKTVLIHTDDANTHTGGSSQVLEANNGDLFVPVSPTAAGNFYSRIFKSSDGGETWSTHTSYSYVATKFTALQSAVKDRYGNLYFAGEAADGSNIYSFLIYKSTDQGATWAPLHFSYGNGANIWIAEIFTDGAGEVLYLSGSARNNSGIWSPLTFRSINQGQTWTLMNEVSFDNPGNGVNLQALFLNDWIFVSTGVSLSGTIRSLVRIKDPQGNWTSFHDSRPSNSYEFSHGIVADLSGAIHRFVTYYDTNNWIGTWRAMKSVDFGSTWTETEFKYVDGKSTTPSYAYRDKFGNIWVTGIGFDSANKGWALVRRLGCD